MHCLLSSVGSEQADISVASPPRADTLGASARPTTRSLCMSTAHWTFLLSFLILVKVVADPGACADLFVREGRLPPLQEGHSGGSVQERGYSGICIDLVLSGYRAPSFCRFTALSASTIQRIPRSYVESLRPPKTSWHKSNHRGVVLPCHVVMKGTFPRCWKCGQEWGQCSDPSFTPPDRRGQAYNQHQVQPPPWDGQQWHNSNSGSWSPRTRTRRLIQSRTEKGEGQRYMARWRPNESSQRTRQRYGAPCTSTDTIAAFHAVSHDAPVPAADDAGTAATTLDRQGCWQNKEFSCDDAHDASGATRSYDICCTDHAMGYSRTDDGTTSGTDWIYGYELSGDIDWAQTRWTSTAKAEQIAQGDEEGRRQSVSSFTSHRSRDAETRREKTTSKTCLLQSKPWAMPSRTCSKPKMHGLSSCRSGSRSYNNRW